MAIVHLLRPAPVTTRVAVRPELLDWAVKRSRRPVADLATGGAKKLEEWLVGEERPTMKQLEEFARKARVPFGYLFLSKPPREELPLPDFRTKADATVGDFSPDLLEVVLTAQRRQDWMRDYLTDLGEDPLPFAGSVRVGDGVDALVAGMRETLGLRAGWNVDHPSSREAFAELRDRAEAAGVLVSVCGYAGTDTNRTLDVGEFRGFVLADEYAPLVFVNGADAEAAKLFTLAHELAHVWLGRGGVVDPAADETSAAAERHCNAAAAEFLIPAELLKSLWREFERGHDPFRSAAGRFNVSPIAAARRSREVGLVDEARFFRYISQGENAPPTRERRGGGGNFYATQRTRLGRRFSEAVVAAVRAGDLLYTDAFRLTGLHGGTFDRYAASLAGADHAG